MPAKKRGKSTSRGKSGSSSRKKAARKQAPRKKVGPAKSKAGRKPSPSSGSGTKKKARAKARAKTKVKAKSRAKKPRDGRPLLVETARYYDENETARKSRTVPRESDVEEDYESDVDVDVDDLEDVDNSAAPDYDETIENEDREKFMAVGDHLEELRRRLLGIIAVVILGAGTAGFFVQDIHTVLSEPYRDLTGRTLFLATVYGPLETLIKLSITLGVSVSLPLSFFILWGFVTPALGRRGAITGNVSILASALLFWGGMVFCWFYVFPLSLKFMFTSILPAGTEPQITLEKYYSFFFLVHIGAGLAFQLPLIVIVLGALGVFPLAWHKTAYKYVLVGISVFAALITDPNPLTQLAMGGMLGMLYAISLAVLWLIERGRRLAD